MEAEVVDYENVERLLGPDICLLWVFLVDLTLDYTMLMS